LWHVDSFLYTVVEHGADIPTSTVLVGDAVHWGVSFGVAVILSAVVVYAMLRNYNHALLLSVWLLGTSIVLSLVVIVAMTLPMESLCGELVPTWTNTFDLGKPWELNDAAKRPSELECGID